MAKNKETPPAEKSAETVDTVDTETGEVKTLPALTSTNRSLVLPSGLMVELEKQLNKVLLRHEENSTVFITITGKTYTGKEIKGSKMAPATMVPIVDLLTGQEKEYIVNAVMLGLLDENYPNGAYVGQSFAVFKGAIRAGKRYADIQLSAIKVKKQ